jgi:hypothetical protein
VYNFLIAILLYSFAEFIGVFVTAYQQFSLNSASTMIELSGWIFIGIFTGVAILNEFISDSYLGHIKPITAVLKIVCVIFGTSFFWSTLVDAYPLINGSGNNMVVDATVAIIAMSFGICLRFILRDDNQQRSIKRKH